MMLPPNCNRTTKTGRPCKRQAYTPGSAYTHGLEPIGRGSCKLHLTPVERARDAGREAGGRVAYFVFEQRHTPACWEWDVPADPLAYVMEPGEAEMRERMGRPAPEQFEPFTALRRWHDSRCAMCGRGHMYAPGDEAEDHDHETGWTRGFLCKGCNIHEGHCRKRSCICARYRERTPADILGVQHRYTFLHIRGR